MSSRKSARSSSKNNNANNSAESYSIAASGNKKTSALSENIFIFAFAISIIIQGSVLYYLYNLEDADCNCIRDWRHNFCKAFALLVLFVGIVLIGLGHLCKLGMIIYYILGLINVYSFFTYVGDLNSTQCSCAVNKQSNLNMIMRGYRWVLLFSGIFVVIQLLSLLGIGGAKAAESK